MTLESIIKKSFLNFDLCLSKYANGKGGVLHICSGSLFGGIEKMLLAIAKKKDSGGSGHSFAYCNEGIFSTKLKMMVGNSFQIGPTRISNPFSIMKSRKKLKERIFKNTPRLIVLHDAWSHAIFARIILQKNIRLARMFHSFANQKRGLLDLIADRNRPDCFLANSYSTKNSYANVYPGSFWEVCYPPCLVDESLSRLERRHRVRAGMLVSPKKKVLLTAGRFEEYKGHQGLFKALVHLPKAETWECWIAGEAQRPKEFLYKKQLERLATKLGIASRLRWLGHIDCMEDLYAGADVYCQPNTSPESFGMTFVEAQAMGCPVITTAFGGALETVEREMGNILLDQPSDENIAMAIRNVLGFLN